MVGKEGFYITDAKSYHFPNFLEHIFREQPFFLKILTLVFLLRKSMLQLDLMSETATKIVCRTGVINILKICITHTNEKKKTLTFCNSVMAAFNFLA